MEKSDLLNMKYNRDPQIECSYDETFHIFNRLKPINGFIKICCSYDEIIFSARGLRESQIIKKQISNSHYCGNFASSFLLTQLIHILTPATNPNITVNHDKITIAFKQNKSLEITFSSNTQIECKPFTYRVMSNCEDGHECSI